MRKSGNMEQEQEDLVMEWYGFLMAWKPDCVLLDKEADKILVNLLTNMDEWKILEDERDLTVFTL